MPTIANFAFLRRFLGPVAYILYTTSLLWWFLDWARILTGDWNRLLICCELPLLIVCFAEMERDTSSTSTCRRAKSPKWIIHICEIYLACSRIYSYYTRICSSRHTKTSPTNNMLYRVSKSVKRWMELTTILQLHRPCIYVSNKFSNYMEVVRNYSTREGVGYP